MKNNLAIVIPAYKSTFLPAALDSIAAQTCKDFTLYIGDDCSPNNIGEIVDKYEDKINIIYKRFDTNLGGKDLVAQWERCIDMTQDEEWIWLFSDDDMMDKNCVEEFYKTIEDNKDCDIFHFDINVINSEGQIVKQTEPYPKGLSAWDFCKQRTDCKILSFVVEYVYRKTSFIDKGRFQNFDMAWGSDVATITKLIGCKTLGIINNARVSWRQSDENISPNKSVKMSYRKLMAVADYTNWINTYFFTHGKMSVYLLIVYLKRYKQYFNNLPNKDRNNVVSNFMAKMGWDKYTLIINPLFKIVSYLYHKSN